MKLEQRQRCDVVTYVKKSSEELMVVPLLLVLPIAVASTHVMLSALSSCSHSEVHCPQGKSPVKEFTR